MKLRGLTTTMLLAVLAMMFVNPGCTCGDKAVSIQPPNVSPMTTGEKIRCRCDIDFSQAANQRDLADYRTDVDVCLPANYSGRQKEFCEQAVSLFVRETAERLAINITNDRGLVCGGSVGDHIVSNVTCAQRALKFSDTMQPVFSEDEPACKGTCPNIPCRLGNEPGANCSIVVGGSLNNCQCTSTEGCNPAGASSPVCSVAMGGTTTVTQALVASPMTGLANNMVVAEVNSSQSQLDVHVELELACVPVVGCATASDDAHPHVSGTVSVYGGPCTSCDVLLEGDLAIDTFSMTVARQTHTIADGTARLRTGARRVRVSNGQGIIPAGGISVLSRLKDNGVLKEVRESNPMEVPFSIDWSRGQIVLRDVTFRQERSWSRLNLVANFAAPLLSELQKLKNRDTDRDGVPDERDNCPRVANPAQNLVTSPRIDVPVFPTLASCRATLPPPGAEDLCFGEPVRLTNNAPSPLLRGQSIVNWTVTDARGRQATSDQRVTVTDTTRPLFTSVPPAVTIQGCGTGGTVNLGRPTATDDCGTPTITNNAPAAFPAGTTMVTWTVRDDAGNSSTATQAVTVNMRDTTAPKFSFVPPAVTISQCTGANIGQATAADACGAITISNDAPAKFPLGKTTVTWTARDAAGNRTTAKQTVTAVLGDDGSCCPAGTTVIVGTALRDTLRGTAGKDCILGLDGDDIIDGAGGDDFISGGAGRDDVQGGPGKDVVLGGADNDVINGGPGDDTIDGGSGTDTCAAGGGKDKLSACEVKGS
jgi:hypothetical protein